VGFDIDMMGSMSRKDWVRCVERKGQEHIICCMSIHAMLPIGHNLFFEQSR